MDHSDETGMLGPYCFISPYTFLCDEFIGPREFWSCGDGEFISSFFRLPFQTLSTPQPYCNNLRNLNHMCEAFSLDNAWTLPNGMCEFELDYDDPRFNVSTINTNSSETCAYLLKCALTNGLEHDCPCRIAKSCFDLMLSLCPDPQMIQFPKAGLIRPYIVTFYAAQTDYDDKTPADFILSGSVRCLGYRAEAFNNTKNGIKIVYNWGFMTNNFKDYHFCSTNLSERNASSLVKFYPSNCWNDSRTFSNIPYKTFVCPRSQQCISQYRVLNGMWDCSMRDDEGLNFFISPCANMSRHRFRCSQDQATCLAQEALVRC